jgi:hypothetical protein
MREMGGDHVTKLCCKDLAFKAPLYTHFREQDTIRGLRNDEAVEKENVSRRMDIGCTLPLSRDLLSTDLPKLDGLSPLPREWNFQT